MADVREAILVRLVAVAQTVGGATKVGRNLVDLPDDSLDAIVVMDGDEDIDEEGGPSRRRYRATMRPAVHGVFKGTEAELGPKMNAFRAAIIEAVLSDAQLLDLTLNGRGARPNGCATGFATDGERIIAEIGVGFAFTYELDPDDL